ncbi:putative spermidine/putrescine transport system permease protein [Nakamurella sp. UYEF19]|uniref:ABC transporter permease n=1 Tax=Nakamurella sp. UYEF19 TaxID=1756392 RepID=UPI0033924E67
MTDPLDPVPDRLRRSATSTRRHRPGRPLRQPVRLGLLLAPALVVVGVFLLGGVAQALAQSFGYQPYLSGSHLSTDAYTALWTDPAVRASLLLTVRVAVLSTALSAVLAVAAALLIRRLGRGRAAITGLFQANLAVPHLVGALCMMLLLSQGGLLSRLAHLVGLTATPAAFPAITNDRFGVAIIAEYVWKETPFLTVLVLATLGRGAADLEAAARVLGARAVQRLRYVTLPLLAPALAGGSILVFAFAAGSYEVPYLLGRPYPATLPVVALQYFDDTDLTSRPQAMAVAALIAVLSGVAVAGYLLVVSRLSRRAL